MCLAIPMRIRAVDGLVALCEARGFARTVNLFLLQDEAFGIGDFVLVHLDSAIRRIDRAEAEATWALYDEVFATSDRENSGAAALGNMQRSNFAPPTPTARDSAGNVVIGSSARR